MPNFHTRLYLLTNWDNVTDEEIKTRPVFTLFIENDLTDEDETVASEKAEEDNVRYDILARAIPALSYATAVDPLDNYFTENFNMEADGRAPNLNGAWPTEGHGDDDSVGRWLHSDFKNNAIHFVYPMYQKMINQGFLDGYDPRT